MNSEKTVTPDQIIAVYRKQGRLNRGVILLKGDAVREIARETKKEAVSVRQTLEAMRKQGIVSYRDDRPEEAEFLFDAWKARQKPPPTPPIPEEKKEAPMPPAVTLPQLATTSVVMTRTGAALEKTENEKLFVQPAALLDIRKIAEIYQHHGLLFIDQQGNVRDSLILRRVVPVLRKVFHASAKLVTSTLEHMRQCGWMRFRDNDPEKAEFLYLVWSEHVLGSRVTHMQLPCRFVQVKDAMEGLAAKARPLTAPTAERDVKETVAEVPVPETEPMTTAPEIPEKRMSREEDEPEIEIGYEDDADGEIKAASEPPQADCEEPAPESHVPQNAVENAVTNLVEYLRADDACDGIAEGLQGLTARRIVNRFRGASVFFAPLLEGSAERALAEFETFRDTTVRDVHELDRRARAQPVVQAAPKESDICRAVSRVVTEILPPILDQRRSILMNFRGERRRQTARQAEIEDVIEAMEVKRTNDEFDVYESSLSVHGECTSLDQLRAYEALLRRIEAHGDELDTAESALASHVDTIIALQVQFRELETAQEAARKSIGAIRSVANLIGEDLDDELKGALEEAETKLTRRDYADEVYNVTEYERPKEIDPLLARVQKGIAKIEELKRPRPNSVFRNAVPRQEQLRRLMVIAVTYAVGIKGKKGQSIDFYARRILVGAGLITEDEIKQAHQSVFADRKDLFDHVQDGRSHRYSPTAKCRELYERYAADCSDLEGIQLRILAAWQESARAWAEKMRLGKKEIVGG